MTGAVYFRGSSKLAGRTTRQIKELILEDLGIAGRLLRGQAWVKVRFTWAPRSIQRMMDPVGLYTVYRPRYGVVTTGRIRIEGWPGLGKRKAVSFDL